MDTSWILQHQDNALIAAIRASNFELFLALLDAGIHINSNDYLYSRDGRLPTFPIHVAANNLDTRFLRTLIERGADPDDARADPRSVFPEFDNVFRRAVRAGLWDNVEVIIGAGGVRGDMGIDLMWQLHFEALTEELGSVEDEGARTKLQELAQKSLQMTVEELAVNTWEPSDLRLHVLYWNSICTGAVDIHEDIEAHHELTNLAWTIAVDIPTSLFSDAQRLQIVDQLLDAGADVSCYTSPSWVDTWNIRAQSLRKNTPHQLFTSTYDSPMQSLDSSYHTLTTPLHTCVLRGNAALLRHLVSRWHFNLDMPEFSTRAYPPLFLALAKQDFQMATVIRDAGARIDFVTPIMHVTALHVAAATRNAEVLRWVVDCINKTLSRDRADALFEQVTLFKHTPLHVACFPPPQAEGADGVTSEVVPYTLDYGVSSTFGSPLRDFWDVIVEASGGKWTWSDKDQLGNTALYYREKYMFLLN